VGLTDHIALAVDFSEPSRVALKATFKLAEVTGTRRVTILYATRDVVFPHGQTDEVKAQVSRLRTRIDDACRKSIDALVHELGEHQCAVDYAIVHGAPARVIPKTAKDIGATMLVLGTHARKGIKRLIMGSIAETMIRGAELPTLVATAGEDGINPDVELGALKKVLIAVDVDQHADDVVRMGLEAARAVKSHVPSVTLLTVTDVPMVLTGELEHVPEARVDMEELRLALANAGGTQLEALKRTHAKEGLSIETKIIDGDADEEILNVADQLGVQLIVIGTHGRGHAPLLELGSTVSQVVRHANVSVLVVPTAPSP
jgi:nucleotide-binding universal stress UspA family protein